MTYGENSSTKTWESREEKKAGIDDTVLTLVN
jgi:hypothetical protein